MLPSRLSFARHQRRLSRCRYTSSTCKSSAPQRSCTMASNANNRRGTRRPAAFRAEEKIKMTLDEISGWSASDVSSSSSEVCRRLSEFDDLRGQSNKKSRKEEECAQEEAKMSAKSDASSKEGVSGDDTTEPKKEHEQKESNVTTTDPSSSESPSSSEASSPEYQSTADAQRAYREQRRRARNQHSNGPLVLSRRLSWNLSKAAPSPAYSPITATRLVFTPAARAKTNRAH